MRASILSSLTGPAAGPIAASVALVLAGGLAASTVHAHKTEAALKAQVTALAGRNEQAELRWQAKLSACRTDAAAPATAPSGGRLTRVEDGDAVADRLANQGPAGFDVCARMEAADAAVLASLRAK
jgi:hypothetical protein